MIDTINNKTSRGLISEERATEAKIEQSPAPLVGATKKSRTSYARQRHPNDCSSNDVSGL